MIKHLSRGYYTVVIVALTITLVAFIAFAAYTPLDFESRISKEQALTIIKQSFKVDTRILTDSVPTTVELQWMKLDWSTNDWIRESALYHMFLVASPPTDYQPFWLVKYNNRMPVEGESWDYEGKYIVDAISGTLMASIERAFPTQHNSTLSPPVIYFWTISMDPPQADFDKPYKLKPGETLVIDVIAKAGHAYDASLPLTFDATVIRPGLIVSMNATNAILKTGSSVSVRYSVSKSGIVGPNPTPNPNWGFSIDVHDIFSCGQSLSVFVEP